MTDAGHPVSGSPQLSQPGVPVGGWLTAEQQQSWRSWLALSLLLPDQLNRDLQRDHGLTLADYEILVWLSEAADHQLRMSELAERTLSSRSRLSHQIDRMERSGYVERRPCHDDRRGFFAVLTSAGLTALTTAAPDHVDSVREHLVDVLSPEQLTQLGEICGTLVAHLDANRDA